MYYIIVWITWESTLCDYSSGHIHIFSGRFNIRIECRGTIYIIHIAFMSYVYNIMYTICKIFKYLFTFIYYYTFIFIWQIYEGDWVDGLMDGTGTYEWNSNPRDYDQLVLCMCSKYTGQWSKSKKHGNNINNWRQGHNNTT